MRIFQNSGIYPSYRPRLNKLTQHCNTFEEARDAFLGDRFGACHFLKPILDAEPSSFFTNGDDLSLQYKWANQYGLSKSTNPEEILLAQIEHHRAEVFYNLDPVRFSSSFIRRLPGCVKKSIAWRAAHSPGSDFSAYDIIVNNFPKILEAYRSLGWRTAFFSPAYDPVMEGYAHSKERLIDVLFVGGYTRHHSRRAAILEGVSTLANKYRVVFCLDSSPLTKFSESIIGRLLPLGLNRRQKNIQKISRGPVFGLELYELLSQARIVLNGAIDMAGNDRGNMRCFEALGCGAMLLSDQGIYPEGLIDGNTLITYSDLNDLLKKIPNLISDAHTRLNIAQKGHAVISTVYSKSEQWKHFQNLVH